MTLSIEQLPYRLIDEMYWSVPCEHDVPLIMISGIGMNRFRFSRVEPVVTQLTVVFLLFSLNGPKPNLLAIYDHLAHIHLFIFSFI